MYKRQAVTAYRRGGRYLAQRLPQSDAGILREVVAVDLDITAGFYHEAQGLSLIHIFLPDLLCFTFAKAANECYYISRLRNYQAITLAK